MGLVNEPDTRRHGELARVPELELGRRGLTSGRDRLELMIGRQAGPTPMRAICELARGLDRLLHKLRRNF